jgi:hypothetical protein
MQSVGRDAGPGDKWKKPGVHKEDLELDWTLVFTILASLPYFLLYFLYRVTVPFEYAAVTSVN